MRNVARLVFVLHRFDDGHPILLLEAAALPFGVLHVQPLPLKCCIDPLLDRLPESRTFCYRRSDIAWKVLNYVARRCRRVYARRLTAPTTRRMKVEGSGMTLVISTRSPVAVVYGGNDDG